MTAQTFTKCLACGWQKRNDPSVPWCDRSPKCEKKLTVSSAQRERRRRKDASGKYEKYDPCMAGCGKRISSQDYYSTKWTDSPGVDDAFIAVCPACAGKLDEFTLEELQAEIAAGAGYGAAPHWKKAPKATKPATAKPVTQTSGPRRWECSECDQAVEYAANDTPILRDHKYEAWHNCSGTWVRKS